MRSGWLLSQWSSHLGLWSLLLSLCLFPLSFCLELPLRERKEKGNNLRLKGWALRLSFSLLFRLSQHKSRDRGWFRSHTRKLLPLSLRKFRRIYSLPWLDGLIPFSLYRNKDSCRSFLASYQPFLFSSF